MTTMDGMLHEIAERLKNIRWRDFQEAGIDNAYYDWYYAEDGLYLIRDRLTEQVWFTEAKSPEEAYSKFDSMMKEMIEAGDYHEEVCE